MRISKMQADLRRDRAGFARNGVCYRLYSEEEYNQLPTRRDSEIERADLSTALFCICASRIVEKIEDFPFIERPPDYSFINALKYLDYLQVIDENHHLTEIGKKVCLMI